VWWRVYVNNGLERHGIKWISKNHQERFGKGRGTEKKRCPDSICEIWEAIFRR
jgi:hypothetical protein